jgi:hypothetical protein
MKTYTVYRIDYPTNKTEPIGTVVDRRKGERNNNAADMLRLAQKLFARSSIDSHIYILGAGVIFSRPFHFGPYNPSSSQ